MYKRSTPKGARLVGILLFLAISAISLTAQTSFGAFQDNDWFNPNNWTNGLPGPGNDATVVGGVTAQISSPLTADFTITNYGTIQISARVDVAGSFVNVGTLVNTGTIVVAGNFQTVTSLTNQNVFSVLAGGTASVSGTFDNQGSLVNEGAFTHNGTLNNTGQVIQKGQFQLNGQLANSGSLDLQGGQLLAANGSQLLNQTGGTMAVAQGALCQSAGVIQQSGTLELHGAMVIDGQASGNGSWTVYATGSLAANNQLAVGGILTNEGFVAVGFKLDLSGTFHNAGFLQNSAYVTVLPGGKLTNAVGGQIDNQFGSEVINEGLLDNQADFLSVGDIINKATLQNTGSIYTNTGGSIDNSGTLNNNGFLSNIDQIVNTGSVFNYNTISNASGGVFTNNGVVFNYSSGRISNDFDFINNNQLTNEGTIENGVRIHNHGTFTNDGLVINIGDFTNSPDATFVNNQVVENNAGGIIVNDGTMENYNEWFNNACSELVNNGLFVNDHWFTNKGLVFQNGTWSGTMAIMHMDGGVEITNGMSDAICESVVVGIGPDGQAVVTAALIALPVVENCDALDLKVNGQAQVAFDCSQIGAHTVTLELSDRLGNTASCTAKVEIADELSPVFENCPTDMVVEAASAETPVSWTEPTVTDNCGLASVVATHQPGDLFPTGDTQVSYTATDVNGLSNQCHFTVTVVPAGDCAEVQAIRKVQDTYTHCGGAWARPYVLFLEDGHYYTAGEDLRFVEYHDGTALLVGSVWRNGERGWLEVYFSGRTEVAPAGSPKYGLCTWDGGDSWYFYTAFEGNVFLPDGDRLSIHRYGPAFQVGQGANLQDPGLYGASGWFAEDDDYAGDFNFRLAPETLVCENSIWLEAECASAKGGAWALIQDGEASNGQALRTPDQNRYHYPPTADADKLVFEVAVAQPGAYRIFARARAVDGSTDSYWVRVNGGAWIKWNKVNRLYGYPDAWAWDQVGQWTGGKYAVPLSFELHGGVNTIEVAWREAGARIDKLVVTMAGKRPDDAGAPAVNCGDMPPPPEEECNNRVLFVTGYGCNKSTDIAMLQHLEQLGFEVEVQYSNDASADHAADKALVLISSSAWHGSVQDEFKDVPVPVITWNSWLYPWLGMTGPSKGPDFGAIGPCREMVVVQPDHPLAAGMSGTVPLTEDDAIFNYGRPSGDAAVVGVIQDSWNPQNQWPILFGYEAGDQMVSGTAPARRVGLFMFTDAIDDLTPQGWTLIDAAIQWALDCTPAAPPTDPQPDLCNNQALFVVGKTELNESDQLIVQRLQSLGYQVTVVDDDQVQSGDADGKGIVIISSTVYSGKVGEKFTWTPVPVLTWESWLYDDLHMTAWSQGADYGKKDDVKKIRILDGAHPITQGATGKFKVYKDEEDVRWGRPQGDAAVLGVIPGTDKAMLFAYDQGDWMRDMEAPARRVGFFLDNSEAEELTGTGWALFDAAVNWAAGCDQSSGIEATPELLTLEARRQDNRILLRWTNNTAWKNDRMALLRSADGRQWEELEAWDAFAEEDDATRVYSATDEAPLEGANYYRVRIRHLDGTLSFSPVREIHFEPLARLALYPNPASDELRILTDDLAGLPATITLVDGQGRIVRERQVDALAAGFERIDVRTLPDGQYFLHVMVEGHRPVSEGVVVQH